MGEAANPVSSYVDIYTIVLCCLKCLMITVVPKVRGISLPSMCTTLVLKWVGGGGGWAFAPNFTEFVVVNVHGVFSAHVAHNLGANTLHVFWWPERRTIICHHARLAQGHACGVGHLPR